MTERNLVAAARIRQELADLDRVVARAEQAMSLALNSTEHDFYLDSAALNLHDFYGGLERIFRHIAADVDQIVPGGPEWHRDLLEQMSIAVSQVRPSVLSANVVKGLDEYLRFRHIVRNVYAFKFDVERIDRLVRQLRPLFNQMRVELLAFADFLERV
ncbi:MAG: hypothetical protein HYU64_16330 [Armatimonadetes bacterium]|nr:hypothetical protein [Armatimonadota bacterium]